MRMFSTLNSRCKCKLYRTSLDLVRDLNTLSFLISLEGLPRNVSVSRTAMDFNFLINGFGFLLLWWVVMMMIFARIKVEYFS